MLLYTGITNRYQKSGGCKAIFDATITKQTAVLSINPPVIKEPWPPIKCDRVMSLAAKPISFPSCILCHRNKP